MNAVFTIPAWVRQLTPTVNGALPEGFVILDDVGERHGSWQWTATRGSEASAEWVVISLTQVSEVSPASSELPDTSVSAWQLTPDASAIVESTVAQLNVPAQDKGEVGPTAVGDALATVIHSAVGSKRIVELVGQPRLRDISERVGVAQSAASEEAIIALLLAQERAARMRAAAGRAYWLRSMKRGRELILGVLGSVVVASVVGLAFQLISSGTHGWHASEIIATVATFVAAAIALVAAGWEIRDLPDKDPDRMDMQDADLASDPE